MSKITTRKPSVKLVGGHATTTSLKIAESFGKLHKIVLRTIANMECSEEFRRHNFVPSSYINAQNKEQPMFTITRDGFAFLASGFTGKEAAQWKERYIEAFNKLEQAALDKAAERRAKPGALKALPQPVPQARAALPALTGELQTRINRRAWALSHAAYEEFRDRMQRDILVQSGHTQPEDWQPEETRQEALQDIEVAAHLMEAHANMLRVRGKRLAKLVGVDYYKATAKYRPSKDEK